MNQFKLQCLPDNEIVNLEKGQTLTIVAIDYDTGVITVEPKDYKSISVISELGRKLVLI